MAPLIDSPGRALPFFLLNEKATSRRHLSIPAQLWQAMLTHGTVLEDKKLESTWYFEYQAREGKDDTKFELMGI